jgi:hypothetical protein
MQIDKKSIAFELEGVLLNLCDNDMELSKYDSKVQIKSHGDDIITHKEFFIKFRPYLREMLRALR